MRNQLAEVTRIRSTGHGAYRFHVSLGYKIVWLSAREQDDLREAWQRWTRSIATRAPVLVLGAPEFCTFDDMFAFHRQFYLA